MAKGDAKRKSDHEAIIRAEIARAIDLIWHQAENVAKPRSIRVQVTLDSGQVIGQRRELRK